jgi:hypothetical protein
MWREFNQKPHKTKNEKSDFWFLVFGSQVDYWPVVHVFHDEI